ncbi:hypothetical protein C6496_14300 [Candidatus Poribacteria bacterium]|nr:MAG: hypothetical protein C6496_14300 [Candidatus Poribacteria bacterium]
MLKYQLFPRSVGITEEIRRVIECFEQTYNEIKSPENELKSNEVLDILRPSLEQIGFTIEIGKARGQKIPVPVLFGLNNTVDQSFNADGISDDGKTVLEVEAGRATANFAFLKDIFQASMMHGVEFLILAVRNDYRGNDDFQKVYTFLETLYISSRLVLPLKGIILIGY